LERKQQQTLKEQENASRRFYEDRKESYERLFKEKEECMGSKKQVKDSKEEAIKEMDRQFKKS